MSARPMTPRSLPRPGRHRTALALALALATCALLAACASGAAIDDRWVQAYAGPRQAPADTVTLVRSTSFPFGYPTEVDGVNYTRGRTEKLLGIEILPGEHTVTLQCEKVLHGNKVKALPTATGVFKAGHLYTANCADRGNSVGARIVDVGVAPPGGIAPRPAVAASASN